MIREMAFKDLNEIVDMGNKFHADALKIHKLGNSTDDFIRYLAFLVDNKSVRSFRIVTVRKVV